MRSPDDSRRRVRTVALAVVRRPVDGAVLLGIGTDPSTGTLFCRPVGGGIEFGERSEEAVRREYREEVGAELAEVRLLAVLENLYTYRGEPGHEIAFVYEASFLDPALNALPELPVAKKSLPRIARWFRPDQLGPGAMPLVPEGLRERLWPDGPPPRRPAASRASTRGRGARPRRGPGTTRTP